jgi:hypothetical protein
VLGEVDPAIDSRQSLGGSLDGVGEPHEIVRSSDALADPGVRDQP